MRSLRLCLLALAAHSVGASAQSARVEGRVIDSAQALPVVGAIVRLMRGATSTVAGAAAGDDGRFVIPNVAEGSYRLVVSRVGYRLLTRDSVLVGSSTTNVGSIVLSAEPAQLEQLVVSASRKPEKMLDAPASIFTVSQQTIAERASSTVVDHLRAVPGLDIAAGGVIQSNVVARGFNSLFSGDLMLLVDNRFAFVPSLRVNVPSLIAPSSDDIDRVEVVLGPAAALYGPNAASGVVHIITRSPFESQGTTVALDGGERNLFRGAFRHAQVIGDGKFAFKVSGELLRAQDFPSTDSVEQTLIAARHGRPRDFGIERNALEGRADYRPDGQTEIIATIGRSEIGKSLEPTGESGTAQVRDWVVNSYQLRAHRGRAFGQVFFNQSDAGTTTPLRSGIPLVDRSRQLVAQIQHGVGFQQRNELTYGLDLISTTPVTGGTIDGHNESNDGVLEIGAYAQNATSISKRFELVTAARLDKHNRLEHAVFSPRVALMFKPSALENFRLSYNRAFATPANYQFFADETVQPLAAGLPYQLQLVGMPNDGFSFRRDCGGGAGSLCMRTPFGATPSAFVPAVAAPYWQAAVAAIGPLLPADAQALLPLFRSLNPTAAQVATRLAALNTGTGEFDPLAPTDVTDFQRLRPTLSSVVELGYKGTIGTRFVVAADAWRQVRRDFVFFSVVTPNVFLDAATLQTYLTSALANAGVPNAAATAAAFAPVFASLPLGTVQPDSPAVGPNDIALSYRNFALVRNWGLDVGQELVLNQMFTVAGTYSFLNKNLFTSSELHGDEVSLNAPQHKGSVALRFRDDLHAISGELRGRYVGAFPVHAGVYQRDVAAYTLADATFRWHPAFSPGVSWGVTATNLLNRKHYEFAGGAELGRMIVTRVQYNF